MSSYLWGWKDNTSLDENFVKNTNAKLQNLQAATPDLSQGIKMKGAYDPDPNFAANNNFISFGHPGSSEDFMGYSNNTFYFKDSPGGGDTREPNVNIGGALSVNNLAGTGTRMLVADANGNVSSQAMSSNWNMNGNDINFQSGVVSIGTATTSLNNVNYSLVINGKILTKGVRAQINDWADFVFDKNYKLIELAELEKFIIKNRHLPSIPTEKEVLKEGIALEEINKLLLQKVEELTLYLIAQNKRIKLLEDSK